MVGSNQTSAMQGTLGFRFAVLASLIISVVSFLTTWSGLRSADPSKLPLAQDAAAPGSSGFWENIESFSISFGLALGIQAIMLSLAWVASRLVMIDEKKNYWLIGSIFLGYFGATAISVTFSYVDLFDRLFSTQKSDWSTQTIRERGDIIVENLLEELEKEERDVRTEFSRLQASFQAEITLLSNASAAQKTAIISELDQRKAELSKYQSDIRLAAVSRGSRIDQLETSVASFAESVKSLTAERRPVKINVDTLTAEGRAKEDQKLLEERGAEESGASGRGPIWRELDREHDIVKARLEVAQNRLDRIDGELENAQKALLEGRKQLATLKSSSDTAAVETALNADDVRVTFLKEEIKALEKQAAALDVPVVDFSSERISETQINQIQSACTQIKSELIAAQSSAAPDEQNPLKDFNSAQIDCTSGGAFDTARNLFALQDSITAVKTDCRAIDNEAYSNASGGELIEYIRSKCVNTSALSAKSKRNYLEDLRRVQRTRDPEAAPIAYAFVALQDRETQAVFALGLALAADLLILIVSLFGNAANPAARATVAAAAPIPPERREPALFQDT